MLDTLFCVWRFADRALLCIRLEFVELTKTFASDELRRRFVKAESMLFRLRYESDDALEREAFLGSRDFDWIAVRPYNLIAFHTLLMLEEG